MINNNCKVTELVGKSNFIQNIKSVVEQVSKNNASVLLAGERGTGKRLIAQHIHYKTDEKQTKRDFFEVNCKSPDTSDMISVFSGIKRFIPVDKQITLFVNHVDEMKSDVQSYFLQCIDEMRNLNLKVKIISATESNLEVLVEKGIFLKELFFKLSSVVLNIEPLRQRKEDILPIAEFYRQQFCKQSGISLTQFSANAIEAMENQFWRGNVDELINSIQKAFMVYDDSVIKAVDLGLDSNFGKDGKIESLEISQAGNGTDYLPLKDAVDQFKKNYITKILEENGWNQTKTARILGIQRTYVIKLIKELQIKK